MIEIFKTFDLLKDRDLRSFEEYQRNIANRKDISFNIAENNIFKNFTISFLIFYFSDFKYFIIFDEYYRGKIIVSSLNKLNIFRRRKS